jgi:hypothetical protein
MLLGDPLDPGAIEVVGVLELDDDTLHLSELCPQAQHKTIPFPTSPTETRSSSIAPVSTLE